MGKYIKPAYVLRALLISYIVTAVLLLLLALVLFKWRPGQQVMTVGVHGTYMISCFLGGLFIGRKMGTKRFLWGVFLGALYFAILFIMALTSDGTTGAPLFGTLMTLVLCGISAGIGGIL